VRLVQHPLDFHQLEEDHQLDREQRVVGGADALDIVIHLVGDDAQFVELQRGWLLAAVGLLGKILGPIGLAILILTGQWPLATIILCLTNDLIWWIPFARYLVDAWPWFRDDIGQDLDRLRHARSPDAG